MTTESNTETGGNTAVTGEQPASPQGAGQTAAPAAGVLTGDQAASGESAEGKAEGESKPEVPEAYAFTAPEGVELDKSAVDEFSTIAKELKLSQADAQKVADVGAKMVLRQQEAHAKQVDTWIEALKTDSEIGGEKATEHQAIARSAVERFGTPEMRDLLQASGLGNHPELVRFCYRIGKATADDGFVRSTGANTPETTLAKKMFPNMN